MSSSADDRRIRSLRPLKPAVDPWRAHGTLIEEERRPNGTIERALTVFLAGAECPFTCAFCDLWRWTIDGHSKLIEPDSQNEPKEVVELYDLEKDPFETTNLAAAQPSRVSQLRQNLDKWWTP